MRFLVLALANVITASPALAGPSLPRIAFVDSDTVGCRELSISVALERLRADPNHFDFRYRPKENCSYVHTGWSVDIEQELKLPFAMSCVRIRKALNEPYCLWIASALITPWPDARTP